MEGICLLSSAYLPPLEKIVVNSLQGWPSSRLLQTPAHVFHITMTITLESYFAVEETPNNGCKQSHLLSANTDNVGSRMRKEALSNE